MKKLLSVILAVVMVAMSVPVVQISAEGAEDYIFEFNSDGTEVTISNYINEYAAIVVMPEYIDDVPVKHIANYAFDMKVVTDVYLPRQLETIGIGAFNYCFNLNTIVMPDSLTTIGHSAFLSCSSLTSVVLPDSVTTIGMETFAYCSRLTEVWLPQGIVSIGDNAFADCDLLTDVYYDGTRDQWNAVKIASGNDLLLNAAIHFNGEASEDHVHTEVNIEGRAPTCEENGISVGVMCSECGEVLVAQEVMPPYGHQFEWVEYLAPTCTESGHDSYEECTVCGRIQSSGEHYYPLGHDYVDGYCARCGEAGGEGEEHIHNEMYLEERAPTCTANGWTAEVVCADCGVVLREKEIIPAFGHSYVDGVCSYCGESNGEIEEHTHSEVIRPGYAPTCTLEGLTETVFCADCGVILSDAQILPSLGHYFVDSVCQRCGEIDASHIHMEEVIPQVDPTCTESGWTEWIICHECGEQLTHSSEIAPLGHSYVDGYCERCYEEEPSGSEDFTYEIIDGNVTITGAYDSALSITVPEYIEGCPVTAIGNNAFYGFEGTYEVNLPSSITSIGDYAFAHTSVQHMVLPENLTDLGEGAFYSCSNLMSVVIPEGVQFIMPGTFEGCVYLSEVTLNDGLIAIHRNAFTRCYSLESIDIPASISKIDGQAFSECYDLRNVNIAEGNGIYYSAGSAIMMYNDGRLVAGIGGQPIPDDGSVKIIGAGAYYKSYWSRSLVIPDGVQYIDAEAFAECGNVFELTLPESIIKIGNGAFAGTMPNVVYYNGTREQWENVEIGYDNDALYNTLIVFSDGSTNEENNCDHILYRTESKSATCTEDGYTSSTWCGMCGEVIEDSVVIPALGHEFSEYGYCNRCGIKDVEDHEHNEIIEPETPATCTDYGYTGVVWCDICYAILADSELIYPLGHEYSEDGYCVRCGEKDGFEHIHNVVVIPGYSPTCTEYGMTEGLMCSDCGEIIQYQEEIHPLGHSEVVLPDLMPTCIFEGMTGGVQCDTCGEILVYPAVIDPLGHDFVDGYCQVCGENESGGEPHIHTEVYLPSVEPTCTENGWTDGIVCGECGFVIVEQTILPAFGHSEELFGGYEPTCTESGMMDFLRCYICGEILSDTMVIPPLGHEFVDGYCTRCGEQKGEEECNHVETIIPGKRPTCTEEGLSEGLFCSLCGLVFWEQQIVAPEGHCEEWVYGWEATCTESGMTEAVRCYVCGEYTSDPPTEIAPFGHIEQISYGWEPSCWDDGMTDGIYCGRCGEWLVEQTVIPTFGHNFEYFQGVEPTCTTDGYSSYSRCSVCGYEEISQIFLPALGHYEVWTSGIEATCTSEGLSEGCYCERCGETIVGQYATPMLPHYEIWENGWEPTCTEYGKTDRCYCGMCGEELLVSYEIPPMGHTEEIIPMVPPTCTEEGISDGKYCSVCYETLVFQEIIPAFGHWEEWLYGHEATCTEEGLTDGKWCVTCGETTQWQEYTPPLGHEFVDGYCTRCGEQDASGHVHEIEIMPGVAPTCTDYGSTDGQRCITCGEVLVRQEYIEPIGHNFVDGACTRCYKLESDVDYLTFEIMNGCAVVTGSDIEMTEIIVPETLGGCPVTKIGDWAFSNRYNLRKLTLPETVSEIGIGAFSYSAIEEINIPAAVTYIPDEAFNSCIYLKTVYYGGTSEQWSKVYIGEWNDGLNYAAIIFEGGDGLVDDYSYLTYEIFDGVAYIVGCEDGITNVVVPAEIDGYKVVKIENYAFAGLTAIETVTISEGITTIGMWAFSDCKELREVALPESLEIIGGGAFMGCSSLEGIYIPENVWLLGGNCFQGCYNLAYANIPSAVDTIYEGTFYECYNLSNFVMGENVVYIGGDAFGYCTSLVEIELPDCLEKIMTAAFRECVNLEKVNIPENVVFLGDEVFFNCEKLTSIVIPEGITNVGNNFFYSCDNLVSVTLPESLLTIGSWVFYECYNLKEINIPTYVTEIGSYTFCCCMSLYSVSLPEGLEEIAEGLFNCCSSLTEVTMHNNVSYIDRWAFSDCENLETVYYKGTEEEWHDIFIDSYNEDYMSATIIFEDAEHTHKEEIIFGYPATCTEYGLTDVVKCSICGEIFQDKELIYPLGHNFVDGWCERCGEEELHVHSESILEGYRPTCTEDGMTEGIICYECGEIIRSQAVIPAMGHSEEIIPSVAPTCVDSGLTDGLICSVCGEILAEQAYIEALGHEVVNGACTRCDYTEVEVPVVDYVVEGVLTNGGKQLDVTISIKGNIYNIWSSIMYLDFNKNALAPIVDSFEIGDTWGSVNCIADVSVIPVSSRFEWARNCVYVEFVSNDVEKGMPYSDGVIVKLSFEVLNAEEDFNLNYALWSDRAEYEPVASNHLVLIDGEPVVADVNVIYSIEEDYTHTHTKVIVPGYAPTCTEPGLTDGISCEECGEVIREQTVIAANGHSKIVIPGVLPTCKESGISDGLACEICGLIILEQTVVEALGHAEEIIPGTRPTCKESGLTDGIVCGACGEIIREQTAIAPVNHNYVDGECSYCGLVLDTEKFLLNVTSEMIDGKLYVYYDINNNPGIWSIMADLSFNAEAIELVGVYNGVVFTGGSYSESPVINGTHRYFAALESIENCYENGILVTYVFDILDSTKSFDITVTIDPENVFNCDFENQEITIVNEANKEIETPDEPEVSIGDINGDNSVNTQDLFRVKLIMQTIVEPTDAERAAADVNGDGLVNAADIFALSYRILYGEWV